MGITTALTPQWVVSSSTCTNFWLLLPLSPWPPVRLRPILGTLDMGMGTSTDLTTPPGTLDLSPVPATSPSTVCTRERPRLRPDTVPEPTVPTVPMPTPPSTDTVWLESLDTQELPPPSLPDLPRD